jgi:D-alanyl-D-alanine carboxypeptidase
MPVAARSGCARCPRGPRGLAVLLVVGVALAGPPANAAATAPAVSIADAATAPGATAPSAAKVPASTSHAGTVPAAASALPACVHADRLTPVRQADRVADTLVDTALSVGRRYVPADLVSSSRAGLPAGRRIRAVITADLRAMVRAAGAAGVRLRVNSAYRSYAEQANLLASMVRRMGRSAALLRVARPGHSEHQLGVALDVASTPGAWTWLGRNASRYGFVRSYPKGRSAKTCYQYEPWHVRWVGRARARAVDSTGLVYREWLWRNVPDAHP